MELFAIDRSWTPRFVRPQGRVVRLTVFDATDVALRDTDEFGERTLTDAA